MIGQAHQQDSCDAREHVYETDVDDNTVIHYTAVSAKRLPRYIDQLLEIGNDVEGYRLMTHEG